MTTNSIDKLVTTYEAGEMELDLQGDIVAKIVSIGKTLDEALVYARTLQPSTSYRNDTNLVIIPPMVDNLSKSTYWLDGTSIVYIANLKLNNASIGNPVESPLELNMTYAYPMVRYDSIFGRDTKRIVLNLLQGFSSSYTAHTWLGGAFNSSLEKVILNGATFGRIAIGYYEEIPMNSQGWHDLISSLSTATDTVIIYTNSLNYAKIDQIDLDLATSKGWTIQTTGL